jgi:hypothetical protein
MNMDQKDIITDWGGVFFVKWIMPAIFVAVVVGELIYAFK